MFKKTVLTGMTIWSLAGCSVATYSHKLQDVESGDRVGITFDNRNLDYMRVYPNSGECINIDAPDNGYTNNAIGFQTRLNNKILGFPEIPETSVMRREFWVSARGNIAIRMIAGNGSFHTVSFKPTPGSYYYVTGSYKTGEVFVSEVYKTGKGYYDKRPVTDLKLQNCDSKSFRFQHF